MIQISIPYNGLFSLGQIFVKRWIFALEGNFASYKFTNYHLSYLSCDFVPGRFFWFLLRQQQSYQAKTGVSEFITLQLRYVLNLNY